VSVAGCREGELFSGDTGFSKKARANSNAASKCEGEEIDDPSLPQRLDGVA
jgi:hypothetical protein